MFLIKIVVALIALISLNSAYVFGSKCRKKGQACNWLFHPCCNGLHCAWFNGKKRAVGVKKKVNAAVLMLFVATD